MSKPFAFQMRNFSLEHVAEATFAALCGAAAARYQALNDTIRVATGSYPSQEERIRHAGMAFTVVAQSLPTTNPFRAALEEYRDGPLEEWINALPSDIPQSVS